jgi:outer membrane protein assembly factor BamB
LPAAPQLAWQKDVGNGILAPIEARGAALFITTTNRAVVALAHDTGRRYWIERFNGAITTGITIGDGRLYFATADVSGSAHALDATRGRRVWSRRIGPSRTRPLLNNGRVIVGTEDGWIVALRAENGAVAWRTRLSGGVLVPPIFAGNNLLVATAADSLFAVDAATGALQSRAGLPAAPSAPGLLQADTLVLPLQNGMVASINAATLQPLRTFQLTEPVLAAPVELDNSLFVLNRGGELWRLGSARPERVAALGGAARNALSVVDRRLVVGLLDGRLLALDPTGTQVWEYRATRSVSAPVTGVGSALFVPLLNGEVLKLQ